MAAPEKKTAKTKLGVIAAAVVAVIAVILALLLSRCGKATETAQPEETNETVKTAETETNWLAERLAADGTDTIELNEDVVLDSLCYVNGEKTITGTGRILMEVDGEYVIVLNDGASLTIDGPTIDGTGAAQNGIYVSENATLNMKSGSITGLTGHGVRVLGKAEISGGSIDSVGTNWMIVDAGAEAVISGGSFTGAGEDGIVTGADSTVTLGSDVTMAGAGGSLLRNSGNTTVEGGSYSGAEDYAFYNEGTMSVRNVEFTGAESLGYIENAEGGSLMVEGGSMTESKADFIYNRGCAVISGVAFDGCSSTAIESRGLEASLSISNCTMENIGMSAILCKNTSVTAENVTIGSCGSYGIYNRASDFSGKNITIASAGEVAVYNDFAQDGDTAGAGTLTLDGFEIGTSANYGIRTNGGTMTLSNGTVGQTANYGMYVKDGDVTTNNVDFLGTVNGEKCVIQIGLSTAPAGSLTMNETTVTGGARGITNHGTLVMNSGKIYGNHSAGETRVGAGVNNTGTFIMNGGSIVQNSAASSGGGVYNQGTCTLNAGAEIVSNYSGASGGGVATKTDGLTVKGALISSNIAANYGGGIYVNAEGSMVMYGGTVENNTAGKGGAGISNSGNALIYGGVVSNNKCSGLGGGVYTGTAGTTTIGTLKVTGNSSGTDKSGGGIANTGTTTINGAVVTGNTSGSYGGGIANSCSTDGSSIGHMTINSCTVTGNTSTKGGGGIYNTGVMTFNDGTVSGNTAGTRGTGIYTSGTLDLKGGTVNGSSGSEGDPYDLYIYKGTATLSGDPDFTSVYVASTGTLAVGGALSGNAYNLYLSDYSVGATALTGSSELVAVNKDRFTLPSDVTDEGKYIAEDGTIAREVTPEPAEAQLLKDGTVVAEGTFEEMKAQAQKGDGDTVKLLADISSDAFTMGSYTIDGNSFTITLGGSVTVKSGTTAAVTNATITGTPTDGKALFYNQGTLTVSNATVQNVSSSADFGGFVNNNGAATLTMTNVKVTGVTMTSTSKGDGAAVYNGSKGKATITNCTFTGNTVGRYGDVYTGNTTAGSLVINGSSTIDEVYLGSGTSIRVNTALTGSVGVRTGSTNFKEGNTILTGETASSVSAVKLLNSNPAELFLGEDGKLQVPAPVVPDEPEETETAEAQLSGSSSQKGSFSDMCAAAQTGDTVTLLTDVSCSGLTMGSYTIDGGSHTITLSASIEIPSGVSAAIKNATITASTTLGKAVLYNQGTLNVTDSAIQNATVSAQYGGAVNNNGSAKLTMTNVKITGITMTNAKSDGAAVYNGSKGTVILTVCSFSGNTWKRYGEVYNGNAMTINGSSSITEVYLASGKTVSVSKALTGSVGVRTGSSNFVDGTVILTGDSAELAASVSHITLRNTNDAGLTLGEDGILHAPAAAEGTEG